MCRSTNLNFCRKKPIIIMHTNATKNPVPVGRGRGTQVTTNLITAAWCHITTVYSSNDEKRFARSASFFFFFLIHPCLCVPVKMSVGTETEKFWVSLWELQAECTGLLWVERHPWARGEEDLGRSARGEEETWPVWAQTVSKVPVWM